MFVPCSYAFAYGREITGWDDTAGAPIYGKNNPFIGVAQFGGDAYKISDANGAGPGNWAFWFFQWAFVTTAATIPAGSVAERFNFNAYFGYSLFVAGFVYPVVAHWAWANGGWLGKFAVPDKINFPDAKALFNSGYIDFAGSGVVHMVGGVTGLCGAYMVGPRLGRFDADGNPVEMPGHSAILVVLGTIILWFGWYGFNPASALMINNYAQGIIAGRSAVTTTLAGAAGGLACLLNGFRRNKSWDLLATCNGILCGFVSITAGCSVLEPWAAILAGAVGGLWFDFLCWAFLKMKIDDPVAAAPMHGGCGAWGVLVVGLLARREYVDQVYGGYWPTTTWGCFYPKAGGGLLGAQVVGILVIFAWTAGLMLPFFGIFKYFGVLRIPPEQEEMGLDRSKHGGSAYNQINAAAGDNIMRAQTMGSGPVKVAPAPAVPMSA